MSFELLCCACCSKCLDLCSGCTVKRCSVMGNSEFQIPSHSNKRKIHLHPSRGTEAPPMFGMVGLHHNKVLMTFSSSSVGSSSSSSSSKGGTGAQEQRSMELV